MQLVAVNHAHHSRITKCTFCNGPSARPRFSPVYSSAFHFKERLISPLPKPKSSRDFILATVVLIKTITIKNQTQRTAVCDAALFSPLLLQGWVVPRLWHGTEHRAGPRSYSLRPHSVPLFAYLLLQEKVQESREAPRAPGLRWCEARERRSPRAEPATALTPGPKSHRGGFLFCFVGLFFFA